MLPEKNCKQYTKMMITKCNKKNHTNHFFSNFVSINVNNALLYFLTGEILKNKLFNK